MKKATHLIQYPPPLPVFPSFAAAPSRRVTTNQDGAHKRLAEIVRKHEVDLAGYRRPIPAFSREAFEKFERAFTDSGKDSLVLDSCCGDGESSARLARLYKDSFVVGVDRSAARLAKHDRRRSEDYGENYCVVRAPAEDFWRLLAPRAALIRKHFLFYPNPYPKSCHVMRRWHAHPLFSLMARLAPETELRTNWRIYAEEFALSAAQLGFYAHLESFTPEEPFTAFERKYHASAHELYRVVLRL